MNLVPQLLLLLLPRNHRFSLSLLHNIESVPERKLVGSNDTPSVDFDSFTYFVSFITPSPKHENLSTAHVVLDRSDLFCSEILLGQFTP